MLDLHIFWSRRQQGNTPIRIMLNLHNRQFVTRCRWKRQPTMNSYLPKARTETEIQTVDQLVLEVVEPNKVPARLSLQQFGRHLLLRQSSIRPESLAPLS